jgi:uncharacterized protein
MKLLPLLTAAVLFTVPLPAAEEASTAALKAWKARDYTAAAKLLEAPLAAGEPAALFLKARMAETGRGAPPSLTEAAKLYQQAAGKGSADAGAALGRFTIAGLGGIEKDTERGLFLIRKAAESGSTAAMKLMGDLALGGAGQEPDAKTALFWYQRAAQEKDANGYLGLAVLYDAGAAGLVKDDARATSLVLEAVKTGEPLAMNEMGLRYQTGRGIARDNVAALGWFSMAAQHDLPAAHVNLGLAYRTGNGCLTDFDRAGQHFASGARLGFAPAQFHLAVMFETGEGTEKQPVFAYVNYTRAAAGGVKEAEAKRDALKSALTPAQLAEAEKMLAGEAK